MTQFHAVLLDETRCEFGADVTANTREEAYEKLRENYPESQVVQLESPEDTRAREQSIYDHVARGGDWDEDGRPIGGHDDWDEEYDEDDY